MQMARPKGLAVAWSVAAPVAVSRQIPRPATIRSLGATQGQTEALYLCGARTVARNGRNHGQRKGWGR